MCQDGGGRCWGRTGRRRPRPLLRGRGRRGLPGTAGRARTEGRESWVGCASSAGLEVRAPVSPVPTPLCLSEGLGAVAAPGAGGSRSPGLGPRPRWGRPWCREEGRRRCRSRGPRCPGLSRRIWVAPGGFERGGGTGTLRGAPRVIPWGAAGRRFRVMVAIAYPLRQRRSRVRAVFAPLRFPGRCNWC